MEMPDSVESMQPFPATRSETVSRMAWAERSSYGDNSSDGSQFTVALRRNCCGQLRHPWELCCHGKVSNPF